MFHEKIDTSPSFIPKTWHRQQRLEELHTNRFVQSDGSMRFFIASFLRGSESAKKTFRTIGPLLGFQDYGPQIRMVNWSNRGMVAAFSSGEVTHTPHTKMALHISQIPTSPRYVCSIWTRPVVPGQPGTGDRLLESPVHEVTKDPSKAAAPPTGQSPELGTRWHVKTLLGQCRTSTVSPVFASLVCVPSGHCFTTPQAPGPAEKVVKRLGLRSKHAGFRLRNLRNLSQST